MKNDLTILIQKNIINRERINQDFNYRIIAMIAYQKEKIENAICFFAFEHKKKTRKLLTQTFLYKYLAFLDFKSVEETGQPSLGLKYRAMERGPVPMEIYEARDHLETSCYAFKCIAKDKYVIIHKTKPNLDYFSAYEIKKMNELTEIYADRFVKTNEISEASHEKIRAWQLTHSKKPNDFIDYSLQFDGDVFLKSDEDLTFPEEAYLTFKALDNMSK